MSTGKKIGIVLLCLLLLSSIAFLLFKDRILAPKEEKPQQQEMEKLPEGELEIIIEQPRPPEAKEMRALALDDSVLRGGTENAFKAMEELGANALSVRIKSSDGKLQYSSAIAEAIEAGAVVGNAVSDGAIEDLTASEHHCIARIAALHDSTFAYRYPGGESMMMVAKRVYNLLDEVKEKYEDKTVMLVCHGGVLRVLHTYFFDMTNDEYFHYNVDNATPILYEL